MAAGVYVALPAGTIFADLEANHSACPRLWQKTRRPSRGFDAVVEQQCNRLPSGVVIGGAIVKGGFDCR